MSFYFRDDWGLSLKMRYWVYFFFLWSKGWGRMIEVVCFWFLGISVLVGFFMCGYLEIL